MRSSPSSDLPSSTSHAIACRLQHHSRFSLGHVLGGQFKTQLYFGPSEVDFGAVECKTAPRSPLGEMRLFRLGMGRMCTPSSSAPPKDAARQKHEPHAPAAAQPKVGGGGRFIAARIGVGARAVSDEVVRLHELVLAPPLADVLPVLCGVHARGLPAETARAGVRRGLSSPSPEGLDAARALRSAAARELLEEVHR
eukprot:CAMPEP_0195154500 /NCGR_PEP_ID=MMETSP0448-20130528/183685_1 /TAXON_ID=66468 /ORGANISM="Heterocapsa triquestra, Strain CCMP 448" /LENGTH=195 /DNA_ID=CAMNT_0040193273 /DNA_START=598 /DNA_END=1180 /DNA_ORIENTATION=-